MDSILGSVVTMELKTLQLLHGWSMPVAVNVDHTFGAGMCAASSESFLFLNWCDYQIFDRSIHNVRIERLWVDVTAKLVLKMG